ncbi:hypothetical protein [Halomicronema sp. CCY15110]|uniref:hypothetical protein n=1 Tax=Halomicronema sp. CCY15110 TaxID=2767773 RepID=UPI00194E70FB|nr:hypothetical protein [Halomicronema sp. CCY15110]
MAKRDRDHNTIHYVPADSDRARRDGGFVYEVSTGFYGVWWAITHPGKALLRTIGCIGGVSAAAFLVSGAAHLIAGEPGTGQFQGADPSAAGRAVTDIVRPHVVRSASYINDATMNPNLRYLQNPDEYQPTEYRR